MAYSRKNPHPHDGSHAWKPHRKGLMTLEIQIGGSGVLNLTLHHGLGGYINSIIAWITGTFNNEPSGANVSSVDQLECDIHVVNMGRARTMVFIFSPSLLSALCLSHSLCSSHTLCKMLCSPYLAHKTPVMQSLCSSMFPLLQSISLDHRKTAVQL